MVKVDLKKGPGNGSDWYRLSVDEVVCDEKFVLMDGNYLPYYLPVKSAPSSEYLKYSVVSRV